MECFFVILPTAVILVSANISRICPPSSRVSPFCHSAEPYGQGHTRLSHIKRRRLIVPLVALVQKNRAHPQLRTLVWCDAIDGFAVAIRSSVPYGAPFLVAAAPRVSSSNK